jgi:RHS repeat-associated protein
LSELSWDGKGNLSQTEYSFTYDYAYPTKTISPIPGGNGSTTALETTVVYDYNTGLPTSTTDANGQTSTMEYVDPLLRPTKVTAPNGHQTITEYGAGITASTRFVKVSSQIDATNWKQAYSWFDGLGRTIKSQSVDSSGDVFVESQFDTFGRPWKTSNPYRMGETVYWTENFYDTAGRPFKVTTPDNAIVEMLYSLATTGSQIGSVVTVKDQALKERRSITNALGQLKRVDEPNNVGTLGAIDAPVQPTLYAYDLLNNLTIVTQGSQTRTFTYDAVSRLKSATNPESGTINYTYDANSNLATKTDARSIATTYAYDTLNRVKTRTYSDGVTPQVSYYYDNLTNAKGKLKKVTSSVSTTEYTAFDILGRVTQSKQTTDGVTYGNGSTDSPMTYTYNLGGALIEQQYPSGRVVKNVLDNDGDLSIVQSKKNANSGFFNYAKNFTYTSAGAVSSMQLGNNRWESTQFNSRLQPTQIALGTTQGTTDKLKLDYSYGTTANNGNVLSQQITVPTAGTNTGFTAIQTYTYDSLNRLKDAKEMIGATQIWKQTFTFDRYGNRNFDEANTTTLLKNCGTSPNFTVCAADKKIVNPAISTSNNRLSTTDGYVFDNAGNTTKDAQLRKFTYDGENKQVKVETVNSGGTVTGTVGEYVYYGDGKRIKKYVPSTGETTIFVYDATGKLVAEYSTVVAPVGTAQVSYLTNDHLGSPRINTDKNGAVTARHDYLPFGEEIASGTGGRSTAQGYGGQDSVRQKFTGYERDGETNLDFAQARYHNSNLGRFSSADPLGGTLLVPQSLNKYVYVANNPMNFVDPSGLQCADADRVAEGGTCISPGWVQTEKEGVFYDSRVVDQQTASQIYGEGATYRPNGDKYDASDGSKIELLDGGSFTQNGQTFTSSDRAGNASVSEESSRDSYYIPPCAGCVPTRFPRPDAISAGVDAIMASGVISLDRYGNVYASYGGNASPQATRMVGGSRTDAIMPSANLSMVYMNSLTIPSEARFQGFWTGPSTSVSVGYGGIGAGEVFNSSGSATTVGVSTPGVGVSGTTTVKLFKIPYYERVMSIPAVRP